GIGAPATQYIETRRPDGSSDGGVWAREYLDGLGRIYRRMRDGGFSQDIGFAPDAPSRVATMSAPYGAGETSRLDHVLHDGLDRIVEVTHADGSRRTTAFATGSRTDTDELGHSRTQLLDAAGRVITVRESDGTATRDTRFRYDPLGRPIGSTDAA